MSVQSKLVGIIKAANAGYYATYDESSMVNIWADLLPYQAGSPYAATRPDLEHIIANLPDPLNGFAYVEEFTRGSYGMSGKFWHGKTTKAQIWFCKFTQLHESADVRGQLREEIEAEVVLPFVAAFNASGLFKPIDNWQWYTPPARFDANEVSIMLEADVVEIKC